MFPLPHGAAWQTLFLICGFLLIQEIRSEGRVVCYYTNWSIYRPGTAKFSPQNINPYLCTHLIYAFGGFTKDNTLKPFDKYQDIEQGGYAKFTGLKSYNKNLKTLLAIGGWNEGSSRFSPLMASFERRQQFIKNILKFLRQNHFDGLDLDWEYPSFRDGGKPRDKENYAQFVEELRSEFDRESAKTGRPRLLLTMAIPAGIEYIDKGYDIPKLNKYLDWFNILSYDYHSAYEPSVNHHAPLRSLEEDNEYNYDSELNIDYTIKYYLNAGAERDKLVLGIPTYGRSYTLINEDNNELGAASDGPGEQGDATREKGYLAYYEICQSIRDDAEWTVVQPNPKAMGPYAYRRNQWVGYDDEDIVRRKAEYVAENGLGGIMFWSIDNDDFRGTCTGKPYPLIEAGKAALLESLGVGDNEVGRPNRQKKPSRSRSRQGSSSRNKITDETYSEKTTTAPRKRVSNRRRSSSTTTTTTTTTTVAPSITTSSSLYVGGRTTTPEPPTTPDPGTDFKCQEEGFFPHPRDCKKYFWCLDSGPSNLGIVAHQFTCPSGLFFNKAADSCDFARNVLCKKSSTTAKPTNQPKVTTTTTTKPSTTTNSPRVTAATSRNTFLRYTTTTTTPEPEADEEEYDDEDVEDEVHSKDSEEDPRVIKELIELIKKFGGLEELEKQLQLQEDGSMVLKNSRSQEVSTTPSAIRKSLYSKVLSRPNSLNSLRNRFGANKSSASTTKPNSQPDNYDSSEISANSDNKYSSVIRNSRPSPQNAGIEKLAEFEGFLKEKPKYVTINRTRPTQAVSLDDEDDDNFEESDDKKSQLSERSSNSDQSRFSTPPTSYVNIRRTRPTVARTDDDFVSDVEDKASVTGTTPRAAYQSINRRRGTTESLNVDDDEPSSLVTSTYRYKTIERTRTTSQPNQEEPKSSTLGGNTRTRQTVNEDEATSSVTVQFSDLSQYTKPHTTQKSETTTIRTYANIARRTTTNPPATTTISSTVASEATTTDLELTTSQQLTTTTSTASPPSQTSLSPKLFPTSTSTGGHSTSTEHTPLNNEIQNENTLRPNNYHTSSANSGLDTEGIDTTVLTDKNTDTSPSHHQHHQTNSDHEVTLTDNRRVEDTENSSNKENYPNIDTSTNSKFESSPNRAQIDLSLSRIDVDIKNHHLTRDTLENTDLERQTAPPAPTHTQPPTGTTIPTAAITPKSTSTILTTPTTTIRTQPTITRINTNQDIQVTVSSPRPFGFPRRRTRPSIIRKSSTTNPQNSADTSSTDTTTTTTSSITKNKVRNPARPQSSRRPVLSVRRRLTTTTVSPSSSSNDLSATIALADVSVTSPSSISQTVAAATATTTNLNKYNRRTRPSYLSGYSRSTTTAATVTPSTEKVSYDISRPTQKHVIRRKFGRPSTASNGIRRTGTTSSSDESSASTTEQPRTTNPLFRRRHTVTTTISPPSPTLRKESFTTISPIESTDSAVDEIDQEAGSSIQDQKFTNNRYNQIGENLEDELVDAIKTISRAPVPKISTTTMQYNRNTIPPEDDILNNLTDTQPITRRIGIIPTTKKPILRRVQKINSTSTTASPSSLSTKKFIRRRPSKVPGTFEKIKTREFSGRTYRPVIDYDYYDDEDVRLVGKSNSQVKVILHGPGIIECLDQGNFPHPLSCRKFISCAKMETGGVVGWEYTCPKGLSYDPVGGICNWAAGLGCKE